MSEDFLQVRQEILSMHARIQTESYYAILGLDDTADKARLGAAYRELAKKWHIDRFSNFELGEDRSKVQDIFSFINDAHRVLGNPESREDYDAEIHDGPDLGAILAAEGSFRSGKNMLQRGSYKGAYEQFKEAHELNPDELEFEAYALYTEFLLIKKDEEGHVGNKLRPTAIYDRLNVISETLTEKDWLFQFMGSVSLGLQKDRRAESLLREALYTNKNNTAAQRQLRLIKMRKEKSESGGFFSRLFKKKG